MSREDMIGLILELAHESRSHDVPGGPPRRFGVHSRALEWSEAAEEGASTILAGFGHTWEHPDAALVCAAIDWGFRHGPGATVESFAKWVCCSRRSTARRLQVAGFPTAQYLIGLGIILRAAQEIETAPTAHVAGKRSGFSNGFELSKKLSHMIAARPSQLRETHPVALTARALAASGVLA